MPRRPADDDEPDEPDEIEDDEPSGPPRPRSRTPRSKHVRELRPWRKEAPAPPPAVVGAPEIDAEDEGEEEPSPGWLHGVRRPVFYRATDTWWFEPLVALALIALLLVGLYAYTGNWPPAYVVESDSMQHGTSDIVGLINTGDLVLAQRINASAVTTYIVGMTEGYRTYGEFGDVILYHPDGDTAVTPIIHRAILYLDYNPNGTYSAPSLRGLACGTEAGAVYIASSEPTGCGYLGLSGTLTLLGIGWMGATVAIDLSAGTLGAHSGFLTMGDNNYVPGSPARGLPDQPTLSTLVEPGWIVGVARGMIPWFGAIKLLLDGDAGEVPSQSWEWLGLTVIGLLLAAMGVHYALKAEGIEDERRKEEEEEAAEEEGPRWRWRPLLRWRNPGEVEEDDQEKERAGQRGRPKPFRTKPATEKGGPKRGGRPRPAVRRHPPTKSKHSRGRDADEDEDL